MWRGFIAGQGSDNEDGFFLVIALLDHVSTGHDPANFWAGNFLCATSCDRLAVTALLLSVQWRWPNTAWNPGLFYT